MNCFFDLWVFVQNVKKATSLDEPRKFTVVYLDIGDNIWTHAAQLHLLRAWLSVPKAQIQARWVWIPHCLPPPEHCGPGWSRCNAWSQVGPFPYFCPIFLPFEEGGFNFPRGQWIRNVCSWAKRKTSKTQDQGHRAPFLTPLIGRWHGSDKGWLLCKVTRGKIQGGFVFTNILPKVSCTSLKNLNYRSRATDHGSQPLKKEQKFRCGGRKGEACAEGGNTGVTSPLLLPSPSRPCSISFFLSLRVSTCSSLPVLLYAMEGKSLICSRAFAPVLQATWFPFLFSQLCLAWLWTRQNNDSMI